tara:strand:+ start:9292 stop:10941 length:1650 start_codon:yes stop_codon:yes gene_type:complete
MNWALGIVVILILLYLIGKYNYKKRIKKFRLKLIENWGKPKHRNYYNFFVIGKYFENNVHKNKAFHLISEKCKIDLDLEAVFKLLDRTSSKIGQQYLYFKLRTIGTIENLLSFNSLINVFEKNESLRLHCQLLLSKLNSNESYYLEELINGKQLQKPKNIWVVKSLTISVILILVLGFIYPIIFLLLIPILAVNMVFHYKNKDNVNYYLQGVSQLSKSLKVGEKLAKFFEIKEHYKEFPFLKRIRAIKFKTEFVSFEKNINNEYLFVVWFFVEVIKTLFNIEYLVFFSFVDSLEKEKKNIEQLFLFIGEIDVAISTASVKAGNHQICTPHFTNKKEIILKGMHHPLIDNCVVNDVTLIDKSMLLTGSNMSGKTTFIRAVALNSVLAQTLHICFAEEYSAPFFRVFSSIRITDDVLDNTSYYLEEVLTVKELVEASKNTEPCLFVLDEIFKGTNTIERISGGKAILSYLNQKNHIVLVSTHDIELTELLEKEKYELFHFREQIENDKLFFDHKLKKGKLKTRNALKILELYKYPAEIILEARKTEQDFFD